MAKRRFSFFSLATGLEQEFDGFGEDEIRLVMQENGLALVQSPSL